ncbi:MAG: hypothetical protein WCW33_04695 [Candidatus Babeliales bacterium]|jgi:hypothetical protein
MAHAREKNIIIGQRRFLLAIFVFALIIRLALFFAFLRQGTNAWLPFDSDQYYRIAHNIAAGNGMCLVPGEPQMYRLPGYPLFLALALPLGGIERALLFQLVLSCLIPILIFFLALQLKFSLSCARLAAVLSCVHAGLITYAGMVATETLFLVFLLLFFIIFLPYVRMQWCVIPVHNSIYRMIGAGVLLGIVSLIRPVGHYLVILSVIMLMVGASMREWLRNAGALVLGWGLLVAPWVVRNFFLTGALLFHSLPGLHFLQYTAAYIVMERDHCSYGDARPLLMHQRDEAIAQRIAHQRRPLTEYEACCCAQKIATSYVYAYPWLFIKTACVQMLKTCCGLYAAQPLMTDAYRWPSYTYATTTWTKIKRFLFPAVRHCCLIFFIYYELFLWLMMIIGLCGACLSAFYDKTLSCALAKAAPYVVLLVGVTLAYGCARLRLPVEPFIIIFSGAGWLWLRGRWLKKKNIF